MIDTSCQCGDINCNCNGFKSIGIARATRNAKSVKKAPCPNDKKVKNNFYDWCIENGRIDLLDKWDYSLNSKKPWEIKFGSHEKVFWKCEKNNHSYPRILKDQRRSELGVGCCYCDGKKVLVGFNDFKTVCLEKGNTVLLIEWDYQKNIIKPEDVTYCAGKEVFWKCSECGFHYLARIGHRTGMKSSCPACAGKKLYIGYNDLKSFCIRNNLLDILRQFKYCYCLSNPLQYIEDPSHVLYGTAKYIAKWCCEKCGYEWETPIYHRTTGNRRNCPVCLNQIIIPGNNDFATICKKKKRNDLLADWDINKNLIQKTDVGYMSSASVFWKCHICGYEWEAPICRRTGKQGSGCEICTAKKHISKPEQALFNAIKRHFKDAIQQYKIPEDSRRSKGYDIFVPCLNLIIEYDGYYYHNKNDQINIDIISNEIAMNNGYSILRIREHGLPHLPNCNEIMRENCRTKQSLDDVILSVMTYLNKLQPINAVS